MARRPFVIIGGLWVRRMKPTEGIALPGNCGPIAVEDNVGEEYLTGELNARISILPNKRKTHEDGPDYNIVLYPNTSKNGDKK